MEMFDVQIPRVFPTQPHRQDFWFCGGGKMPSKMLHFHLQIVCENCGKLSVFVANGLACVASWSFLAFKRLAFSSTSTTANNEFPLLDSRKIFAAILSFFFLRLLEIWWGVQSVCNFRLDIRNAAAKLKYSWAYLGSLHMLRRLRP